MKKGFIRDFKRVVSQTLLTKLQVNSVSMATFSTQCDEAASTKCRQMPRQLCPFVL